MFILNLLCFLSYKIFIKTEEVENIEFFEKYTVVKIDDIDKHYLYNCDDEYCQFFKDNDKSGYVNAFGVFEFVINDVKHTFMVKKEFKLKNNTNFKDKNIPYIYLDDKLGDDECTNVNFAFYSLPASYRALKNEKNKKYNLFYIKKKKLPNHLNITNKFIKNNPTDVFEFKDYSNKKYSSKYNYKDNISSSVEKSYLQTIKDYFFYNGKNKSSLYKINNKNVVDFNVN